MSDKSKIKIHGTMERDQIVAYLENIVNGLKSGTVNVKLGADHVVLSPPAIIDMEMKAAQKKDKEKLSIELSWKTDANSAVKDVTISSHEPKIEMS